MSFFTLLFYFVLLLAVLLIASIVNSLAGGRRRSAFMTFRVLLILAAIYATVLLATTLALPIRVLPMGEVQYSGDWSIAPASLRRFPHNLDENYEVDFKMTDRGNAPLRGPEHVVVYLLGEDGTRYDPNPAGSEPRFDALIQPHKSIITERTFVLPTNLNRVELVIVRKGFRVSWFVIGRSPLDGRSAILLQ